MAAARIAAVDQVDHLEDVRAVLLAVHHQEVRQRELRVAEDVGSRSSASSACTGVVWRISVPKQRNRFGGLLPAFLPDAPYQARQ